MVLVLCVSVANVLKTFVHSPIEAYVLLSIWLVSINRNSTAMSVLCSYTNSCDSTTLWLPSLS